VQQNEWSRARDAAERLATLSPGNPQVHQVRDRIRAGHPRRSARQTTDVKRPDRNPAPTRPFV